MVVVAVLVIVGGLGSGLGFVAVAVRSAGRAGVSSSRRWLFPGSAALVRGGRPGDPIG